MSDHAHQGEHELPSLFPRPSASSDRVRKIMQGVRSNNTKPELAVRKALRAAGMRGYRVNWKKAPAGTPDIAFPKRRLAILVMGCYWHRCAKCHPSTPRTNSEWWQKKFARNIARDKRQREALKTAGWHVIDLWECDLKADLDGAVKRVQTAWVSSA